MSTAVLELCDRIRALSDEEKSEVLSFLKEEIETREDLFPPAILDRLIERQRRVDSGEDRLVPWEEARARLDSKWIAP